jgi:hypothetical protein
MDLAFRNCAEHPAVFLGSMRNMLTERWDDMNLARTGESTEQRFRNPTRSAMGAGPVWRKQEHSFWVRTQSGATLFNEAVTGGLHFESGDRRLLYGEPRHT